MNGQICGSLPFPFLLPANIFHSRHRYLTTAPPDLPPNNHPLRPTSAPPPTNYTESRKCKTRQHFEKSFMQCLIFFTISVELPNSRKEFSECCCILHFSCFDAMHVFFPCSLRCWVVGFVCTNCVGWLRGGGTRWCWVAGWRGSIVRLIFFLGAGSNCLLFVDNFNIKLQCL